MKHARRLFLLLALAGLATSCLGNGYEKFYTPTIDVTDEGQAALIVPLQDDQSPRIIASAEPWADVKALQAERYTVIGVSSFVGPWRGEASLLRQAERVGATVVVRFAEHESTSSGTIEMPSTDTTYHSGTVYDGSSISNFDFTTTSYGTTSIPYNVKRYTQRAWYLAKSTLTFRVGVYLRDLGDQDKKESGRNAGAVVDVVVNDSAAFASNLVPGDVIVAIDGSPVLTKEEASAAMRAIPPQRDQSAFTVVRAGTEMLVEVSGL